jgi:hypothetical protein
MAAVDAVTGAIDPTFRPRVGGSTSKVRTILVSATRVYVGGGFTTANGKTRKNLAAFDMSGNLDSTWAPAADNGVRDLEFSSDGAMIFIGGWFATISGLPRQSVARVTPDTGAVDPWSVPSGIIATGEVAYGLVPTPTRLYVGMGGPLNYAAAYDLSNGNTGTQKWRAGTSGNVNCITKWGSMLVIGGHFTSVRLDPTRVRLAGLNLDGSLVSDWVPKITGSTGGPWNLLSTSTQLYVGGAFTTVSGIEQTYLAEFTA